MGWFKGSVAVFIVVGILIAGGAEAQRRGMGREMRQMGAGTAAGWDSRFERDGHLYGEAPARFLREIGGRLGEGEALVLAMGEGRNAVYIAELGFDVTGVDISPVGVAEADKLAASRGVGIDGVVANLSEWDLGQDRWDLITDFYYLDRALLPRIVAALKPGGYFVLEHFSTDHPEKGGPFGPRSPEALLAPNELFEAIGPLRVVHYEDRVVELDDGMHRGPAALVRLVAQKPAD